MIAREIKTSQARIFHQTQRKIYQTRKVKSNCQKETIFGEKQFFSKKFEKWMRSLLMKLFSEKFKETNEEFFPSEFPKIFIPFLPLF